MTDRGDRPPDIGDGGEPHTLDRRRLLGWLFGVFASGSIAQACDVSGPTVVSSRDSSRTGASTNTPSTSHTTAPATSPAGRPESEDTSTTDSTTRPHQPTNAADGGIYDREALYVALYGFPGSPGLGVLGEQDAQRGALRASEVAAAYTRFGRRVVPTFEVLASIASASAGDDGNYSNEFPSETFQSHLDVAAANGVHVVFDLQTGRSRFPDQARRQEALWLAPHTSIALDPEWRIGPNEQPGGGHVGSVDASEVNETIEYIDALIAEHDLPPKMCIVHQFNPAMIANKELIRGTDNVQVVLQMDGFGPLDVKQGSWGRMLEDLPTGAFTGWKNFYDEDLPTPTAAETMSNEPQPRYVSYQ
jgi:hypothetical protein